MRSKRGRWAGITVVMVSVVTLVVAAVAWAGPSSRQV